MKQARAIVAALLCAILGTTTLVANAAEESKPGMHKAGISTDQIPGRDRNEATAKVFQRPGIQIGDQFPAVDIFDESGQPFNTGNFRGQYIVLINACLT